MSLVAARSSRVIASRALARQPVAKTQKRTIFDYLTNYPDKVPELRKAHCEGGVLQGDKNPTWMKHPHDTAVSIVGFLITASGMYQLAIGYYYLATGKGKMDF